jgi:protein SCO1
MKRMTPSQFPRRSLLESLALAALPTAGAGPTPKADHGRIDPAIPVPEVTVTRHDGASGSLFSIVNQRATAVQLMFTACTTTCPIQGAIFERVQRLIVDQVPRGIQLLSLSVDPEHDTPLALRKWLQRFHARAGWVAAAPQPTDIERIRDFGGRGRNPSDNHTTQVLLINRQGRLFWRTFELPEAEEIAGMLNKV